MGKILLGIRSLCLVLALGILSETAFASDKNSSQDQEWNFYIDAIDAFAPVETETREQEQSRPSPLVPKKPTYMPSPIPNGATPQEISNYNQRLQKSQRDQQRMEIMSTLKSVKTFNRSSTPTLQPGPDFTIATTNSIIKSDYSVKKTNFDWGGKDAAYTYVDYEFSFESTKVENAKKMTDAISEMSKARWEVDLNRSFQRVEGRDKTAKAFTTTQMRFRRRK